MDPTPTDPEDLFWRQLQESPSRELPRLIFADWCDENDRPVMALVQRWLAATGCRPTPIGDLLAWVAENCQDNLAQFFFGSLPVPLFVQLSQDAPGFRGIYAPGVYLYDSFRAAETALAEAWSRATRPRWYRSAWKPRFAENRGILIADNRFVLGGDRRTPSLRPLIQIFIPLAILVVTLVTRGCPTQG